MLYSVGIFLILLWVLGLLTTTLGGFIHVLPVLAVIIIVLRAIAGRKPI